MFVSFCLWAKLINIFFLVQISAAYHIFKTMGSSVDKTTKELHVFVFAKRLFGCIFKVNEFQLYTLNWNISIPSELYCSNTWSMAGIMVNRPDQINYPWDMTE